MLIGEESTIRCSPRPWIKACRRLIWHISPNSFGDTPLHIAARKGCTDIAKFIVKGSRSAIRDEVEEWNVAEAHSTMDCLGVTLLHIKNRQEDLPLFVALKNKHDKFGLYILSIETISNITELKDGKGKNAYEIAIENNCEQSRKMILERTVRNNVEDLLNSEVDVKVMHPSMLKIFRHIASTYSASAAESNEMLTSETVAKLVMEGLPKFKREPLKDAISHLREAAERGDDWLVTLLLKGDNSLIAYSTPAWQIACEKGHESTLLAFIEECGHQDFVNLCHHNQQTPLHHLNLPSYEQYRKLLTNPVMHELRNQLDGGGATPLHRALERDNVSLARALLGIKDVRFDILDRSDKTALDILEEKSIAKGDFFELYKELLTNPLMTPKLKNRVDKNGATFLHRAIGRNALELTKALLETEGIKLDNTALDLLENKCIADDFFELYKELFAKPLMTKELKNRVDNNRATPLHRAILQNVRGLVKALVDTNDVKLDMEDSKGKTALDLIEGQCSIKSEDNVFWYELYKMLWENPDRLETMKKCRGSGVAPLHIAIVWDDLTMAKKLVHIEGIKLNIRDTNGKTALDLIVKQCESNSQWYELYKEVLANPDYVHELKNRRVGKETPLHLVINSKDIKLAKMLLKTDYVEVNVPGGDGKTALDLLKDLYVSDKWGEMCHEINVDPNLNVFGYKYLLRRTPFVEMRTTLSVVAALLATISFGSGFTVPGGVDSKYGTATLATKAVFLVFSISNTLAMCSSIMVLFMVIGALYWEAHPDTLPVIDLCMGLLQFSLLCTIAAFVTGVYAIMAMKVMWAAGLVTGLCAIAFFAALYVIATFWPPLYKLCSCIFCTCCRKQANADDRATAEPPQNQNPQRDTVVDVDEVP